jgi:hypothetical protein
MSQERPDGLAHTTSTHQSCLCTLMKWWHSCFKITRQFGFRCWPRESKVELHKTTFSIKSSSNLSPGSVGNQSIGNLTGYRTNDQYCYPLAETMNCSKNKNVWPKQLLKVGDNIHNSPINMTSGVENSTSLTPGPTIFNNRTIKLCLTRKARRIST